MTPGFKTLPRASGILHTHKHTHRNKLDVCEQKLRCHTRSDRGHDCLSAIFFSPVENYTRMWIRDYIVISFIRTLVSIADWIPLFE